jgi:type I site-specific restriction-modification system R (restriction) subunit
MKFTEEKLEKAFAGLLEQEGFPHFLGNSIARKADEVLLEEDLRTFLLSQYAGQDITPNEVNAIILQLKSLPASDLYESNKAFLRMLADGFILKREDRSKKDIYIQLIDYSGLNKHRQPKDEHLISIVANEQEPYAKDQNIYKFITQFEIVGNGKGGTYFGATGSGKSFTMLYLTRLLMKSEFFESPTIVLITDRTDLDDQLSGQFINAKKFIGDNTVESVESRADLRDKLQGRQSGGVFLTTIQKFTEDTELLSDRSNVICISDEAHRSQVNLDQKIRISEKGVSKSFGFAKYIHDSLPNTTYVGFTGTPIDATLDVFGKVVDAYTMTESVRDEITVRIVYEGRAAKVALRNGELEKIERYYEEVAELGANEYQIDKSKKETANMYAILGDPDHFESKPQVWRQKQRPGG